MDGIMRVCFLCSSFCFNRLFARASYQKCIHTLQLARWVPRLLSQTTLIDAGPNFKQSCTMSLHELRFCLVHDIRLATALAADATWASLGPGGQASTQACVAPSRLLPSPGALDQRLAHDYGQFVGDSCEFASEASMRKWAILCA
jgi:hypothetical protein